MKKEEAFRIGLPKWPQCIIVGNKITKEQALEIIRRTDRFFEQGCGGNNHSFNEKARKICRIPIIEDYRTKDGNIEWEKYINDNEEYKEKWDIVETNYIKNDWVSSSFIYGPNGWCHPDGTISYRFNIGKWPNVEDVYDDLTKIAKAFPFIEMSCTLMSGEHSEKDIESLVTLYVKNGKVTIRKPIPKEKLDKEMKPTRLIMSLDVNKENALSLTEIQTFANKIYA